MKTLIFLTAFLTGCIYHPQFWEQEPIPPQQASPAFNDNHEHEYSVPERAEKERSKSKGCGGCLGEPGNYKGTQDSTPSSTSPRR